MASQQTPLRRSRERELVQATRALFDERGVLDAPIEEIANAVGIARGLIYRQFSSKEELFVLTVTDYLDELAGLMAAAVDETDPPAERAERALEAYAEFCERYPAFLDSSLSLMQGPARELYDKVSESVWLRLGQGMARCLDINASIIRAGNADGTWAVEDPDYMANVLWVQMLGTLHLARIRVGVKQAAPGVPALFSVSPERVVRTGVRNALATLRAGEG